MKAPAILLVVLVGVVGYYQTCAIPQARREAVREAGDARRVDSVRAAAAAALEVDRLRDSLHRAYVIRDSVAGRLAAGLERELARARDSSMVAGARLDSLLAAAPDTIGLAVAQAVGALRVEIGMCRAALVLTRDRLTDCQRTEATSDSLTRLVVPSLHAAVDTALALAHRWQVRARRAGRLLALGPYVGYGMTAADGRVWLGPQLGLGISLRWTPLPPW